MVASAGPDSELPLGDIDISALGRALWCKKGLIFGLTLLTAALAFAAVNFIRRVSARSLRVIVSRPPI